jgi:peptide/nickel transport system substrate-binding protein
MKKPLRHRIPRPLNIFFCFFLFLSGCGEEKSPPPTTSTDVTPAYGDFLVEASIGDASSMIPHITADSASHAIANLAYNGLVKYDKDLKLVGNLAESWDIHDEGKRIAFHLRKGVKWHDGADFTAEDCLFTYHTMIDPKTPTAYEGDFKLVKEAKVIDPYTFEVTYDQPFAPALASWGIWMLPKHLLKGKDITKSELGRHPVGTGPFIFHEWKTGERIELRANPHYFEGKPYIDRIVYRIIPDMATMFLELKSGGVDWMGLTPLQYKKQTDDSDFKKKYKKYKYLSFGFTYLGYNLRKPLFADKRVRRAITYAIDKQEIIDGVLLGLGQIATGPYKPGTWAYNPNIERYPFDLDKSRALLAEAGWIDSDGDGILDKDGKPLAFTIITNQGNDMRAKTSEIIQQRLKNIGIAIKIRIIEWATFLKEFVNIGNYDALILGFGIGHDPDQYDIWHSSKTNPGELNHFYFQNQEVDRLLEEGRHTFDQEKRKNCYWRIQEILAEEQPCTFLYVAESLPVVSSRFHGIKQAPAGISYNLPKWYVPQELQRYTP